MSDEDGSWLKRELDLWFRPLFRTKQEQRAKEIINISWSTPCLVTAFRGIRKSFSFQREARRRMFGLWPVVYLDASRIQNETKFEQEYNVARRSVCGHRLGLALALWGVHTAYTWR